MIDLSASAIEKLQKAWKGLVFGNIYQLAPQPVPASFWPFDLHDPRVQFFKPQGFYAGRATDESGKKIFFCSARAVTLSIGEPLALTSHTRPRFRDISRRHPICGWCKQTDDGLYFTSWALYSSEFRLLHQLVYGEVEVSKPQLEHFLIGGLLWSIAQLVFNDAIELFAAACGAPLNQVETEFVLEELGSVSNFVHYLSHTLQERWWDDFCELLNQHGIEPHADSSTPCMACQATA